MGDGRIQVIVLGRDLGTASGWDMVDDCCFFFYDFIPNSQFANLDKELAKSEPNDGLQISYDTGSVEKIVGSEGTEVSFSGDLIDLLKNM